jgi:hypothetical protein
MKRFEQLSSKTFGPPNAKLKYVGWLIFPPNPSAGVDIAK